MLQPPLSLMFGRPWQCLARHHQPVSLPWHGLLSALSSPLPRAPCGSGRASASTVQSGTGTLRTAPQAPPLGAVDLSIPEGRKKQSMLSQAVPREQGNVALHGNFPGPTLDTDC